MGRMHKLEDFLAMEDVSKKTGNRLRYIKMAFKPCGTLLICLVIALVVAIPCAMILCFSESGSTMYDVSIAILTGVVASALVSFSIEISNNYRRNRQRLIVLHEYLYVVSMYEQFMQWTMDRISGVYSDTDQDDYFNDELTRRQRAVADIELEVVPPVDEALEKGREYLSRRELMLMEQIVEASNSIARITDELIDENLQSRCFSVYDILTEPFKTKIAEFSEDVGIRIYDDDLRAVVFDYAMSNLDILDETSRRCVKHDLRKIDTCMLELRKIVKDEPVYYENLTPLEERFPELRKLQRQGEEHGGK